MGNPLRPSGDPDDIGDLFGELFGRRLAAHSDVLAPPEPVVDASVAPAPVVILAETVVIPPAPPPAPEPAPAAAQVEIGPVKVAATGSNAAQAVGVGVAMGGVATAGVGLVSYLGATTKAGRERATGVAAIGAVAALSGTVLSLLTGRK